MTVGERIKEAREKRGLSQSLLGELVGVSRSSVNQWESGNTKNLKLSNIAAVKDALGVSFDYLITGSEPQYAVRERPATYEVEKDCIAIPYYDGVRLSAGAGATNGHDETIQARSIFFHRHWVADHGYKASSLVVVRCAGVSMEPRICDGDLVLINTDDVNIKDGRIYAINLFGEARIKRLFRRLDSSVVISSDNPIPGSKEEVLTPHETEHLKIIGRAVWIGGDI